MKPLVLEAEGRFSGRAIIRDALTIEFPLWQGVGVFLKVPVGTTDGSAGNDSGSGMVMLLYLMQPHLMIKTLIATNHQVLLGVELYSLLSVGTIRGPALPLSDWLSLIYFHLLPAYDCLPMIGLFLQTLPRTLHTVSLAGKGHLGSQRRKSLNHAPSACCCTNISLTLTFSCSFSPEKKA